VSRAVLGAVVFSAAGALAVLGLPAAGRSVGITIAARDLGVAAPVAVGAGDTRAAVFVVPPAPPPAPAAPGVPTPSPASATPDLDAPTAADLRAGILRRTVPPSGTGEFAVAPGWMPAPGAGEVREVRVEVESGLPVDRDVFAAFVLTTLNDARGWGHGGTMSFARTDGDAPITVTLASPDTSARLCADVEGGGPLSCRAGPRAVLTFQRWVAGTDEYTGNLTGYRQYLVNHEVGHVLGHGHEPCPGPGLPAPVMQQQTLGLNGCTQNSWPYP
jgi:hypothetical protein